MSRESLPTWGPMTSTSLPENYPRYYTLQDDGTVYWTWTGDGTVVKVRLVYQLGADRFHHDFTFRRVKV